MNFARMLYHDLDCLVFVAYWTLFNSVVMCFAELELLPIQAHDHACIKHAVELEQSFMEGAYNRVLSARQAVPHESYVYFMDLLAKTVRYQ